jgi:hypothetical protein
MRCQRLQHRHLLLLQLPPAHSSAWSSCACGHRWRRQQHLLQSSQLVPQVCRCAVLLLLLLPSLLLLQQTPLHGLLQLLLLPQQSLALWHSTCAS